MYWSFFLFSSLYYIDLAKAESEPLDDIYSLLLNKIQNRVMLSGEVNENGD